LLQRHSVVVVLLYKPSFGLKSNLSLSPNCKAAIPDA